MKDFCDAPIIASLLEVLASRHDSLMKARQANPSEDNVVIAQGNSLLPNDKGNIFFPSVKEALNYLALIVLKPGVVSVQPCLIYPLNGVGISPDNVWCVEQEMRFYRKGIWSLYPIPQHIIECTL